MSQPNLTVFEAAALAAAVNGARRYTDLRKYGGAVRRRIGHPPSAHNGGRKAIRGGLTGKEFRKAERKARRAK